MSKLRTTLFRDLDLANAACVILLVSLMSACSQTPTWQLEGVFYPPPPQLPRLQFLTAISSEEDIGAERKALLEFVTGKRQRTSAIARPWSIAHQKDKLYVVDKSVRQVLIIDLANKKFDFIRDMRGGPLENPAGIFITDDDYKYVADRSRGEIVVYNDQNEFHRVYGSEQQFRPVDVAVREDRIYVCDIENERIVILDKDSGSVVQTIGKQGEVPGSFRLPTHITLDNEGNLYVTDFLNFRVQVFDRDGQFLKVIGEAGDFPGAMPRPKGISVDREGHLYAVDSAFEFVQIFDVASAEVLMPFGKFGSISGGSWLPAGVHIDYDNLEYFSEYVDPDFQAKYLVYVANQAGPFKLNVYAFGDWLGSNAN